MAANDVDGDVPLGFPSPCHHNEDVSLGDVAGECQEVDMVKINLISVCRHTQHTGVEVITQLVNRLIFLTQLSFTEQLKREKRRRRIKYIYMSSGDRAVFISSQ